MSKAPEPAIKSYYFGKGYKDLRATIVESWELNMKSASDFGSKAEFDKGWEEVFTGLLSIAAAISVVVFGTAFFLLASAIHIAVLFLLCFLIYVTFTLVYLLERGFLLIKGFSTVCPYCHEKGYLPEYFCDNPKCGNVHKRLIPSSYGIFKHTCLCGQKLPSTFFLNRGRLQARCGNGVCSKLLPRESTESRKLFIAIMGGPSVGKSSYLFSAVWKLIEDKLPVMGFSHDFVESRNESDYQRVRKSMGEGRPPDKTAEKLPTAFNLMLKKGKSIKRLLYLYDPAGEAYAEAQNLVLHKFQNYLSGCIFLIDPFSIPYVRQTYDRELVGTVNAIKPGELMLDDALSRVLLSMEEHYNLSKKERIKFPIAIVINKLDAFDLEKRVGREAIEECVKSSPAPVSFDAARDELLRRQLQLWGEGGFIQRLEERFAKVRYFACSSLGRLPEGSLREFEPRGVLDPLMWILSEVDRGLAKEDGAVPSFRERVADLFIEWKHAFLALGAVGAVIALAFLLWPSSVSTQSLGIALKSSKSTAYKGEPVTLTVRHLQAAGSFSYAWQTTGGRIQGAGPEVVLDTNEINPKGIDLPVEVVVVVTDYEGTQETARQTIMIQPVQEFISTSPVEETPPVDASQASEDLSLQPEESDPANEKAMPQAGTITISADVEGVQLSVDNSVRGYLSKTPRLFKLSPGQHTITASRDGYQNWERSLHIAANTRQRIAVRMARSGPSPEERALDYLRQAERLLQERQYDAAINACNEGLRWDPSNRALLSKRNDIERARQILSRPAAPAPSYDSGQRSGQSPAMPNESFEPATPLRRVSPSYPPLARSSRIAGTVTVQVAIDENGNVISARSLQGPLILQQAAADAARQWKYRPARRGGQQVRDTKTITFNFSL